MNFALYIHYPFCSQRCLYCGFATEVDQGDLSGKYRVALIREIKSRANERFWRDGIISSIYFGGGTPSLMPVAFISQILDLVKDHWELSDNCEITVEANPESSSYEKFSLYLSSGINRLSIGAQSFIPDELKLLGRLHNANQISETVEMGISAGFSNISLDLIYGLARQTPETLSISVESSLRCNVQHLSTYSLSIEAGTPFETMVESGELSMPDSDIAADHYLIICDKMREAGFDHYELTNFAKAGFISKHNFSYWTREPYLGVGAGAHSFNGNRRFWNSRRTVDYIKSVNSSDGEIRRGKEDGTALSEFITKEMAVDETVYLSLRACQGLDRAYAAAKCDKASIEDLLRNGYLVLSDDKYHIPEKKWLLLDEIVLQLVGS